jgi:hypothetical protein
LELEVRSISAGADEKSKIGDMSSHNGGIPVFATVQSGPNAYHSTENAMVPYEHQQLPNFNEPKVAYVTSGPPNRINIINQNHNAVSRML